MADHTKDHMTAILDLQVIDENGKVVKSLTQESDSFLANFLWLLRAGFVGSTVSVKDTTNTTRSCQGFSCEVSAYGVTNSNIIVGSGSAAVTPADYNLASQITTLEHVPLLLWPDAPSLSGSYIECKMCRRSFNNHTANTVTINEIGICVISSTYSILILRDILGSSISLLPNQTLQVGYTFRTAV